MKYHDYNFSITSEGTVIFDEELDMDNFAYLSDQINTTFVETPVSGDLYSIQYVEGRVYFQREPRAMYRAGSEPSFEEMYDQHMEASKYTD